MPSGDRPGDPGSPPLQADPYRRISATTRRKTASKRGPSRPAPPEGPAQLWYGFGGMVSV
jgi:hypothetical protein